MNKKKNIIIILLILVIFLVLAYFIFFNKDYTLTVYKYKLNNEEYISLSVPKEGTLIDKYNVKCNNKCELVTFDYDKTFFVVKNSKEGYIYNINTNKIIDVGSFDKLNTYTVKTKDNITLKIGYLLTRKNKEVAFVDEKEQKLTIPWTKGYTFANVLVKDTYFVTEDGENFINIHTGKTYRIEKSFNSYICYTKNTCVFNVDNNSSFIYNFDEEKTYDYNYKVLIDYENGAVIEKDNKIYKLDFKTNELTYLMDKPNYPYTSYGNYLFYPTDVDKDELLLNFYSKDTCKSYIYNLSKNELSSRECIVKD